MPYDLVLLDWKMPGMDGIETVTAMRANPLLAKMPVTLMITAYGTDEFVAEVERADIAAFLVKPIEPRGLLATIAELFRTSEAPALSPPSESGQMPRVARQLRGLQILLVEDNEINREIAIELLTDAGLRVDWAENGRVACEKMAMQGADYAGVLMDIQMPEMDGIAATKLIREQWSAADLPIIAMTAHAYEEERQRCLTAGMNDHLTKPIDPALLVNRLDHWLARRETVVVSDMIDVEPDIAPAALPDCLPPFDLKAALARMNGKRALLLKLILNFEEHYANSATDMAANLTKGDIAGVRQLAHTLAGVAGSLGLDTVQLRAADVEKALGKEDLLTVRRLIKMVEQQLSIAIAAVRDLDLTGSARESTEAPMTAIIPDDALETSARETLRALIVRRSLSARKAFHDWAAAAGLTHEAKARNPVGIALERLDYDAALHALDLIGLAAAQFGPVQRVGRAGA
jgi:CheY-like chemotaxis protein/HPt (histidine-containing phosphotransfer) domain-containing protein